MEHHGRLAQQLLPHPRPKRLFYWKMAMAEQAHDLAMKLHGVHPDQHNEGAGSAGSTEIRMPGGVVGTKKTQMGNR